MAAEDTGIMGLEDFTAALDWQAHHAEENGAPATARVIRALAGVRASDTATGRRIAAWPGLTLKDAMPLRLAGGFHHLLLTGADDRLAEVYAGAITDQIAVDALVLDLTHTFDTRLLPWLDGPPQTNEAGRSASIMAGLLWLAQRVRAPQFDLFELGASAGVNTMIDRYFFRLGETEVGPADSPMRIVPEWRGASPPVPPAGFGITSVKGCDIAPINLADADAALRLKAYVWPDAGERMARIDAAIALAGAQPPDLVAADAGDFAETMLARPAQPGVARVMFHSIMWQYMPAATQARITAAFEAEGAAATPDTPLGWVALETDPATFRHELRVRLWEGETHHGEDHMLSHAHPHGAWVEWLA
ncbi:DUF2332 domain-containing protein [Erythrobacter sp. W302b]|uniref:DUF2332 domain-containing protein n=1 Tax=Erythrobacter sp. W302b TaxID=3389874 RepID=UPI00396B4055